MKNLTDITVKALFLAILIFCLSGCSINHGRFTVASNKVFRVSDFQLDKADRVKGMEGTSIQHIVFFFPVGGPPSIEEAFDDAMLKGGGDVMTDVAIENWSWYIPIFYGQHGWTVKGDVVKTRKN